ncbi:unannotated protein [freshwater metagenome]|uniref:Unannotated protein n=1 Tax=freshwater metagenome TaxID=449393 RepID=A0A6J7PJ07_9ZZZZ
MNFQAFRMRHAFVSSAVVFAAGAILLAQPAVADDSTKFASMAPRVQFTVYEPKFTAGLSLKSVALGSFDPQAVGTTPGVCSKYLTATYRTKAKSSLEMIESAACGDPGFPMLVVDSFKSKGSKINILTTCPNPAAVSDTDCQSGSTASPADLLKKYGEVWINLPSTSVSPTTQIQLKTEGLTVHQIKRIVRSIAVAKF